MQQLFNHHNQIYAVQKLHLKIKYQAQQIEQLKSRIKQLESKTIQNLIQLLNDYINAKHTLDASTYDKSTSQCNSKQDQLIYLLKQQIITINQRYEHQSKLRLQSQAQLLLSNQIFLQEKQFHKEIIANYQQKILDLRSLIQGKQSLIDIKSQYYETSRQNFLFLKKYRENIDRIEDELIYTKCISNLQKKINQEKLLKKKYVKQIQDLNKKLEFIDKIVKDKFSMSLEQCIKMNTIKGIVEQNQIQLEINIENQEKIEPDLILNEKQQINYRGCCGDFISVLKKQLIKSNNLIQQLEIYKKIIKDLKNSYTLVINANKNIEQKYKEMVTKNKMYEQVILKNKNDQNIYYYIHNFVHADPKIQNSKQLVIQTLKKNYRALSKKIQSFVNKRSYKNKKLLNRSFSCYNSILQKIKYKTPKVMKEDSKMMQIKTELDILQPFIQELSEIQVNKVQQSDFKQYFKQQI